MSESNLVRMERPAFLDDPLTQMLRRDSRKLLIKALEIEVAEYMAAFEGMTDDQGRAAVVSSNPKHL